MSSSQKTINQVLEGMAIYLNTAESNYQMIQKNSERVYRRTTRIIKTVFILLGLLLVVNTYFIYNFGEEIVLMVSKMNDMYVHFGNMATQVDGITRSVEQMSSHVNVLPQMNDSMNSMSNTVSGMNTNVHVMQTEVDYMAQDINTINDNMTSMTHRFDQVNENMLHIEDDVDQMSRIVP